MLTLSHKKLMAWQKSIFLLPLLYKLCKKLPNEEIYNLTNQIKRAALSITNNLAEGAARKSRYEQNRFYEIARSSVVEIDNCLICCTVLEYDIETETKEIAPVLEELFKTISGLIATNQRALPAAITSRY